MKDDTISRQAAIEALGERPYVEVRDREGNRVIVKVKAVDFT